MNPNGANLLFIGIIILASLGRAVNRIRKNGSPMVMNGALAKIGPQTVGKKGNGQKNQSHNFQQASCVAADILES